MSLLPAASTQKDCQNFKSSAKSNFYPSQYQEFCYYEQFSKYYEIATTLSIPRYNSVDSKPVTDQTKNLNAKELKLQYKAGVISFQETNCNGLDLSFIELSYANFSKANLSRANLKSANLYSVNLTNCDLTFTDLSNANLTNANLCGANLAGANLQATTLENIQYNDQTRFPLGFSLTQAISAPSPTIYSELEDTEPKVNALNLGDVKLTHYLTDTTAISVKIKELATAQILWLDAEIADWQTSSPRLSLIQAQTLANDRTGLSTYILDVLDRPQLILEFIQAIMMNEAIEKVFHNANYDLRYLGNDIAKNITCTLELARKITKKHLGVTNLKLKTLATELAEFENVDTESQGSDWGARPLSVMQLQYSAMDVVYLG
jgi:uncharacterized protein YjbI with pentapeptide repeats